MGHRPAGTVTRVLLGEDVSELIVYRATYAEAFNILNAAVDRQEATGQPMTLTEALRFIKRESDKIEELYRASGEPAESAAE